MDEAPRNPGWEALREGLTERFEFSIADHEMLAFANLSGDFNPLHRDAEFARSRGFAGTVVYGGLIVAQISKLLGMRLPGRDGVWASLKLDFRNPLLVDEKAALIATVTHKSEAARLVTLRIEVVAAGRMIASGKAEALVMTDD